LMTGKRYSEFRLFGDQVQSGLYRKSFGVYTERTLNIGMITYANLFCFCTGLTMAVHPPLRNLIWIFPMIVLAIISYFHLAMSERGARLEPEQLLQNRCIIFWTVVTACFALWLLMTPHDLMPLDWL